jgi:Bifunctional DNA primase/polymerase, N-terminal
MADKPEPRQCGHFSYAEDDPAVDRLGFGIPATEYQAMGYAVLPLVRGGKKPHRMLPESGGVHHASLDARQAEGWWSLDPAANIGVATGSKSRLMVIDLDVKGGPEHNGVDSLRRLIYGQPGEQKLDIPEGAVARTPSGGWHVWLRTPEGMSVPERPGILPGVDIKGDGGLVVAAPSMKTGQPVRGHGDPPMTGESYTPYSWVTRCCPCRAPVAPQWVWDLAASARTADEIQRAESRREDKLPPIAELRKNGIAAGERNTTFYKALACRLYGTYGTDADASVAIMEVIREIYDDLSDGSGFTWHEVLTCIQSARKFITWDREVVDPRRQAQAMELMNQAEPWLRRYR